MPFIKRGDDIAVPLMETYMHFQGKYSEGRFDFAQRRRQRDASCYYLYYFRTYIVAARWRRHEAKST